MPNAADRIRELRESKGLTQDSFAELCGLSRSTVARYEGGVVTPSFDTLQRIAKAFGITADYLLDTAKPVSTKASDEEIKFALFGDVSNITDAQFEEVKRYARYIKERGPIVK